MTPSPVNNHPEPASSPEPLLPSWSDLITRKLAEADPVARIGRVVEAAGPILRAELPEARMGELCRIRRRVGGDLDAEVIGFDRHGALLMGYGRTDAVEAGALVTPAGVVRGVPCGAAVRGRVIDALGRPIDGRGPIADTHTTPLETLPPHPLRRSRIRDAICTGVRAVDGCLTVGRGQRIGIFAAAGVGKSSLLGMIAKNIEADLIVVALVGERGREVGAFLEDELGAEGLSRAVVVVSTSDQPSVLRLKAAHTAMAIAEAARREGGHVVLLMDSVTRFARALREVGLAAGEPPGRQGYPASVFAELPRLFERAGTDERGSITGFFTVLVAGDDIEEPVADETMSLLDGHILLSRTLAARGHYPAIDIVRSKSRVMRDVVPPDHSDDAQTMVRLVAAFERNYDKIACNVYERGSDPEVDEAIDRIGEIESFLRQERAERSSCNDARRRLAAAVGR